jgi:glycosyltransferase involved in cell wall biosynthesis
MKKITSTVHMVVKNEDCFMWFALMSILPYADKILITDTGSMDNTIEIIKSIHDPKIVLTQQKVGSPTDISNVRQKQIDETETDWIWVVDGDEIYPRKTCDEIVRILKERGDNLEGIVVSRYDLLGDIYHFQDEKVGEYNLFGKRGHVVLRLINKRKIPGLHVEGIYPYEGYYDKNGLEIINHKPDVFEFTKDKLFHAMYLKRSSGGANLKNTFHRSKWKIEKGNKIANQTNIPEVFKMPRPNIVADSGKKRSLWYESLATVITPVKKTKRKLFKVDN